MYNLVSRLLVYRVADQGSILYRMAETFRKLDAEQLDKAQATSEILDEIHALLDLATEYGFNTNLWRDYISFLIAMTETPFTLVSEKTGAVNGTVNEFVMEDFDVFYQLMNYDFAPVEAKLGLTCFTRITNYKSVPKKEQAFNKNVSNRIRELSDKLAEARCAQDVYDTAMAFYKHYGVGKYGMNKAFRIATKPEAGELIVPILVTSNVRLDDLIGYEQSKAQLVANTEAFLADKPANNVLLYGDAGTGKSTSVKALLNHYYDQGLRIIEVYKHEFKYLPEIISEIKNRNYHFIIYMDDLSFEGFEIEYKYLKAVIEGDLEVSPDNVLIYATSNRRHLIRESFADRKETDEDDVHRNDTLAERLSLADRFGLTIGYYKPAKQEYYNIILGLAARHPEITLSKEELMVKADRWEVSHSGKSGRTAQQFINFLLGGTGN